MMEAPLHQRSSSLSLGPQLQANYKSDHHLAIATSVAAKMAVSGCGSAATTAAETAYLQQLHQTTAVTEANGNNGARGEQSPRCASHDTKFCYYKNYNTSHPRHFCRACRRYWTLGGSLRNVPIGGSTRKCPRLAHPTSAPPASRRHVVFGGGSAAAPPTGLLGSLFALGGAAPVREGRSGSGFELGRGLPMPSGAGGAFGGDGEICAQMQGLGVRDGLGGASELLWPAGLLDNGIADEWKVPSVSEATWPEFSAAVAPPQAGGLLHGGAQLM